MRKACSGGRRAEKGFRQGDTAVWGFKTLPVAGPRAWKGGTDSRGVGCDQRRNDSGFERGLWWGWQVWGLEGLDVGVTYQCWEELSAGPGAGSPAGRTGRSRER